MPAGAVNGRVWLSWLNLPVPLKGSSYVDFGGRLVHQSLPHVFMNWQEYSKCV
jgi:hypothetical protein